MAGAPSHEQSTVCASSTQPPPSSLIACVDCTAMRSLPVRDNTAISKTVLPRSTSNMTVRARIHAEEVTASRPATVVGRGVSGFRDVSLGQCARSHRRASVQRCNMDVACPPRYALGEWGECSTTCGPGVKRRHVRCEQRSGGRYWNVAKKECERQLGHERHVRQCERSTCMENYKWRPTEWSLVSFVLFKGLVCQKSCLTEKARSCRRSTKHKRRSMLRMRVVRSLRQMCPLHIDIRALIEGLETISTSIAGVVTMGGPQGGDSRWSVSVVSHMSLLYHVKSNPGQMFFCFQFLRFPGA